MFTRTVIGSKALLTISVVAVTGVVGAFVSYNTFQATPAAEATATGTSSATIEGSGKSGNNGNGNNGNGNGGGNDNKTFTISGTVTGLYPGVPAKSLNLSLRNNSSSAINIRTLAVTVSQAPAGCSASNILLGSAPASPTSRSFSVSIPVAKNATGSFVVPVSMTGSAPNACAGQTFTLTYTGQADQA